MLLFRCSHALCGPVWEDCPYSICFYSDAVMLYVVLFGRIALIVFASIQMHACFMWSCLGGLPLYSICFYSDAFMLYVALFGRIALIVFASIQMHACFMWSCLGGLAL